MPQIIIETDDVQRAMRKFPAFPREAHAAMNSALNRSISRVVTNITKEVAVDYAVKRGQIKKTIGVKRSRISTLEAEAEVTDRRIKMGSFQFKYEKNRYRSPVSVKIKNTNGFVKSTSRPALFQAKGQIYHRTPNDKYPIGWAFTLSIPQMVANDDVYERISEDANQFLHERFEHELNFRLQRLLQR